MTAVLQISFQEQADGLVRIQVDNKTRPGTGSAGEIYAALDFTDTLVYLLNSCRPAEKTKHRKRSSKRHR